MKIAFSWPWNTGKSTLIGKIKTDFIRDGIDFKHYGETARELLETMEGEFNPQQFQQEIYRRELDRLAELQQENKAALIDRTITDNRIYSEFLRREGIIDETPWPLVASNYDKVFYFTTPFRESKTFPVFNSKKFLNFFQETIKKTYPNASIYKNGADEKKIREEIKNLLQKGEKKL